MTRAARANLPRLPVLRLVVFEFVGLVVGVAVEPVAVGEFFEPIRLGIVRRVAVVHKHE